MKEKHGAILLIVVVVIAAYIAVSTAARNNAIDNAKLLQWRYENAVRP